MTDIEKLQEWYKSQCDGNWEHHYGISIQSLDNPGWWVKIDLTKTKLENKEFVHLVKVESEDDWLEVKVKDRIFQGAGDLSKLEEIIKIFLNWAMK